MSVAPAPPVPEEMERMETPKILANLTFGGSVLVQDGSGMLCSPMGMVTCQKVIQYVCCPSCVQIAFAYTDGNYSKGVQVDSKPGGCCSKPHWTISSKDYKVPAGEDAHIIVKNLVAGMRGQGLVRTSMRISPAHGRQLTAPRSLSRWHAMRPPSRCVARTVCRQPDSHIAKLYPNKKVMGKTVRKDKCCGGGIKSFGVSVTDGSSKGLVYQVKNKPLCCGQLLACPMVNNCCKGITEGNFCMNFKNPIYDQNNQKVAYVVQTVPLFPTSCCTADTGPTVQMAIHQHPDYTGPPLSPEDIHRLALFMYTVVPAVPGGGNGGPTHFIGKIANVLLMKTGWALGFGQSEVETEYVNFKQVFNGEVASTGDLVEAIRSNVEAGVTAAANKIAKK